MTAPTIIKESPISMAEVKAEIDKIKKRDKELSFRTAKTDEYLHQFITKDSIKLVDILKKLDIPRLKEDHIIKIVDLMPKTVEDLKIILQGYTLTVTKDNMAKIIEEVKKFLE